MKTFEEYLALKIIRKQKENPERAKSLIIEAEKKAVFMIKVIEKFSLQETEPNFIIENCYDIVLEMIRALLFFAGYNSKNSHEAEVAYLRNLSFSEIDVLFMDELRYFRNRIKYYGRITEVEYAQKVLDFYKKVYPQLQAKCREISLKGKPEDAPKS